MTDAEILVLLKADLQMAGSSFDTYLTHLIGVAKKSIAREGITLDVSELDDVQLIIMYAAYLYRQRVVESSMSYSTNAYASTGMPRMLRYALNNRLFSEKMQTDDSEDSDEDTDDTSSDSDEDTSSSESEDASS